LDEDDLFSRRKLWLKFIGGGFGNDGDGFGEKLTKPEVGGRASQVAQVWNGSPPPLLSYLAHVRRGIPGVILSWIIHLIMAEALYW
jgi:hypothetical protein